MRPIILTTMSALMLAGSMPSPLMAPAFAQARAEAPAGDPDRICAPYLERGLEEMSYGRGRTGRLSGAAPMPTAPPPMPQAGMAQPMAVTGTRIARPGIPIPREDRERYAGEEVAAVRAVAEEPVSTFGVDVDTGSYANVRRFLQDGRMPPQAAVRTEELLNYFRYDYPRPNDRTRPFSIATDMTTTPWNSNTRLLRVGLRGYDIARRDRPPANLVFLVDVSGSMMSRDKLPLVQCSLALLAERLNPRDRVSIVVYAGAAGRVLDPTNDRRRIQDVLMRLQAGGSTAGAAGIQLAYDTARQNMIPGGINRVILATDGDFNVGVSNTETLVDMVERERAAGIQLTTLGYGTGNYNEAMMEQIADHGNGNYAYIDSPREAQKVLDEELSSTLFTIAQDVKIQVEFNPAYVAEYRLIGYENRALREEDFDNDAVDAGDIGAGHQVTALYEIVPAGSRGWLPQRRYEGNRRQAAGEQDGEMAHLRLRYKLPGESESRLIEQPVHVRLVRRAAAPTGDTAFAAAVAAYGQLLRGDTNLGRFTFADARALAGRARLDDFWRREFIGLTEAAERHLREERAER
ncbi:VWA domain-containing protein [Sphingosinicella sp. YJ22]|uniref:vWA domain-containing protein n=1 Tax=Sphingosinicella sp. YJ22 TaxID=1104780 RepID=UPI00140D5773|nr:VWA domain-containing protein [Sphingosinicella sp. YJ22]